MSRRTLIILSYITVLLLSYFSTMGTEEQFEFFELHICVKDYCFAREDRLVGVSVIALKDISEKVSRHFNIRLNTHTIALYIQRARWPVGCRCNVASKWTRPAGPFCAYSRSAITMKWPKSSSSSNPKFDRNRRQAPKGKQ